MKRVLTWCVGVAVRGRFVAACPSRLLTHFPHWQHLAELECGTPGTPDCLSCANCHKSSDKKEGVWAQPTPERCEHCHEDAAVLWRQSVRPPLATLPAGKAIIFPHDPHLKHERIKGQCVRCHAGAVAERGGDPLFPPMETCLGCHEHREAFEKGLCNDCHRPQDLRTLRPVSFLSHDGAWMRRHGAEARAQP
ncbi:MAG: cytochrome c3 family protein, partial [Deltaproteobacteria bacterium]|nr:cytochrome c3 family protein [Deltaproteobacteria bacterium]